MQNFLKSHGRLSSNVTCCRDDAVVQRTLAEWAPSPSLLAYELPLRTRCGIPAEPADSCACGRW